MGLLDNARHERFAQELAAGETADEAYALAGYKRNRSHASRLAAKGNIQARVAELLAAAAEISAVSIASITDRLMGIADKAEAAAIREVPAKDGKPAIVVVEGKLLSVARAALMDAAKINGLVVDKKEHGGPNGGPIRTELAVRFI